MLKWMGRILYGFLVFSAGMLVLQITNQIRIMEYYDNEALPYLEENNMEEYMIRVMNANGVDRYIFEPLYTAISKDDVYNFSFSIYHFQVEVKNKKMLNALAFVIHDMDIKVDPLNFKNYEANPNLMALNLKVVFTDDSVGFERAIPFNLKGGPITHLEMLTDEETEDLSFVYKRKNEDNKIDEFKSKEISQITLNIIDETDKDKGRLEHDPFMILNTKHIENNEKFNIIDNLSKKDDKTFESTNFDGRVSKYDLETIYENEEVKIIYKDNDAFKPYNKHVIKPMVIYIVIVVIITFLLFFAKPIADKIKAKKHARVMEESTNKEEAIFKD